MLLYFSKNYFSTLSNIPKNILIPNNNKLVNFNEISIIKKDNDIKNIKYASKILSKTLNQISILVKNKKLKNGNEVNSFVNEYLIKNNCYPSSYNFQKFPKSICISPNEIVCHGIPNDIQFKEGDIINFDLTVFYNGMFSDGSIMVSLGKISPLKKKLIEVTKKSLYLGISICKPNIKISEIGKIIENYVKKEGFFICKEFCGHGIGKSIHMLPVIKHYNNNDDLILKKGMTFTIEPIIFVNSYKKLFILSDNWSVFCPGNLSAQFEHTIMITDNGCEILTKNNNKRILIKNNINCLL